MSIKIVMKVREGIALESNVSPLGLGFPHDIASLIAANYKTAVDNDPIKQGVAMKACYGRPNDMAQMFGVQTKFDVEFRIYPLGAAEDGTEIDLWVSEDAEGNTLISFNSISSRERDMTDRIMSTLVFEPTDLDEVLASLATDLSELPSQEDAE